MKHSIANQLTFQNYLLESGLEAAMSMGRGEIIDTIRASGIRGRGGAGFPVGVKWNLCAAARSDAKFVICNADEGEPGTFKDRVLLAEFPEIVFEGMTIAARAIGAAEGIVYLRAEYEFLLPGLLQILDKRRRKGLLGQGILKQEGFDFDIRIQLGAGAYVCGEETALIESLEGHRGEPRNRPPFPVDTGFENHPTIVNNVETLAWVPCILWKGAPWFAGIGTEHSKGPKLFSVSGDCWRPGVYEFPYGVTVQQVLDEIGGAGAKAVQVGGASGVLLPVSQFKRKIAFEDVPCNGSVVVFGPERDLLAVARNFAEFFCDESCGQCTPCREGNPLLLQGIDDLIAGRCSTGRLAELVRLGETMRSASKCGLGQTSPSTLLSLVDHFKGEILGRSGNGPAKGVQP